MRYDWTGKKAQSQIENRLLMVSVFSILILCIYILKFWF
ncbi:hypothetical protein QO002_006196 [Pararhizobium capsulatum DSM 1112]|uniref:Uncharacterized protein n=1 Tax=Pararhizobium capsulatum DSM 1112 TaxID=1121113 RepID=A0ABU0C0F8_9HYPH|nr:hypothetical protein [Pararhizobium capsulatum DSM 1112]MDQ0323989.1 hypothetical protein [Pararhizobium capsulatum DSM 1112]